MSFQQPPQDGRPTLPVNLPDVIAVLHIWCYRMGEFVVLTVLDDPALLALMFC